jgi:cytochrome P450
MSPPRPEGRPDGVSIWRHLMLVRRDLLSSQPDRLYRARVAEFRTWFFRSFLVNEPDLVRRVLVEGVANYPKSARVAHGLRPLLGESVFLTNGETWARQRRIIDPAFEAARVRAAFPSLLAAAEAGAARLAEGEIEIEAAASHMAADAIFRTMFSIPIEAPLAAAVYRDFRAYQRAQPLLNLGAFLPLPRWVPRGQGRSSRAAARSLRGHIAGLVARRRAEIAAGTAPDDFATRLMTARDPQTGSGFTEAEMVDQVAIFFLAGHETSASAIAWALYLLATHPDAEARAAAEAQAFAADPGFSALARLRFTRDVFREALRLYPPVPMMVREARAADRFRDRDAAPGAQVVISLWHLHRHERLWAAPHDFDPDRWSRDGDGPQGAFLPFAAGPRVCPGAGLAMVEGPLFLAALLARWRVEPVPDRVPVPVAHLTVRSRDGIFLHLVRRDADAGAGPVSRACSA